VATLERTEDAFIDGLPEAPASDGSLSRFLAAMDATPVEPAPPGAPAVLHDVPLPKAVSRYRLAPRRWVRPGLWVAHLRMPQRSDWRTYILRAPAGQRLFPHGHTGPELVCVLMGAFRDGPVHTAGDFVEASRSKRHRLTVTADGPCACLIATKGPLVLRGGAKVLGHTLSI
jgi:putative transcriptional regulator